MTRLILTADDSAAGALQRSGLADVVVPILHRFVLGPLLSDAELSASLAPRTMQRRGRHWLDHVSHRDVAAIGRRRQSLIEVIDRCERVELWMDSRPNDQL